MEILWVIPYPIGIMADVFSVNKINSGYWISEAQNQLLKNEDVNLTVVSTLDNNNIMINEKNNVRYICLNYGHSTKYKSGKRNRIDYFKKLFIDYEIQLIQVWGTEFGYISDICEAKMNIPLVTYIQGISGQIYSKYNGIKLSEYMMHLNPIDLAKLLVLRIKREKYRKLAKCEKHTLMKSDCYFTDNEWCKSKIKTLDSDVKDVYHQLCLNETFFSKQWVNREVDELVIFTNASHYPLKGLHIALKALRIIKKNFPNVKLLVPGRNASSDKSLTSKFKKSPYLAYINSLIKNYSLEQNVIFLGDLNVHEMHNYMLKSDIFIMTSFLEHHSSTLREALVSGMPCISSNVGCVPEILSHGVNGLVYESGNFQTLAEQVLQLSRDKELRQLFSKNALEMNRSYIMHEMRKNSLYDCYKELIGEVK